MTSLSAALSVPPVKSTGVVVVSSSVSLIEPLDTIVIKLDSISSTCSRVSVEFSSSNTKDRFSTAV